MTVATSVSVELTPPAVMFSHFGINCDDADKLEDFYTRVLGFCVSDHGLFRGDKDRIIFMTRRPREHHQFVLAGGRPSANASTVGETGFKARDLDALRQAIDTFHISPDAATQAFNHLISGLLAIVFEAADTAVDPDITRALA